MLPPFPCQFSFSSMTFIQQFTGYFSGTVVALAAILYARAIISGKVQSNKVTWFVWIFVTGMICLSYYKENGLVTSIWVSIAYFLGTLLTFILLAFFARKGEWSLIEKLCLAGVFMIIILWTITGSALLALNLTMAVDIVGAIPLLITVYKDSRADYAPAWLLGLIGNLINLFAVERWNWSNASYPVYMVILMLSMTLLVYFPKFLRK